MGTIFSLISLYYCEIYLKQVSRYNHGTANTREWVNTFELLILSLYKFLMLLPFLSFKDKNPFSTPIIHLLSTQTNIWPFILRCLAQLQGKSQSILTESESPIGELHHSMWRKWLMSVSWFHIQCGGRSSILMEANQKMILSFYWYRSLLSKIQHYLSFYLQIASYYYPLQLSQHWTITPLSASTVFQLQNTITKYPKAGDAHFLSTKLISKYSRVSIRFFAFDCIGLLIYRNCGKLLIKEPVRWIAWKRNREQMLRYWLLHFVYNDYN